MKELTKLTCAILLAVLTARAEPDATSPRIDMKVDWPAFLARHDPVWEILPSKFDHGAFAGNGLIGTTVFQQGSSTLRFALGRSDVTEHRRDNTRLLLGGLHLTFDGTIKSGTLRTVLHDAEILGTVETHKGKVSFRAFVHAKEPLLVIEAETQGAETLSWNYEPPAKLHSHARFSFPEDDPPHPAPVTGKENDIHWCEQQRASGGSFTVGWTVNDLAPDSLGKQQRVLATIADTFPAANSKRVALETLRNAGQISGETLVKTHRDWWHAYYPASFVSVPDAQIEGFYWIQMYKFSSAMRPDGPVMDLQGPWNRETGWARIWLNLNIQIAYLPIYAANRLELGGSYLNFIDSNRDHFKENAKKLYGIDDGATTAHTTCYEGRIGTGIATRDWKRYTNPADFVWTLHLYDRHYRFSMDHGLVKDRQRHAFFDLLKGGIRCYSKLFITDAKGNLHLPVQHSPEYGEAADNNYNLSLLRWGCTTLLELNQRYNLNDPNAAEWELILKNLTPYPTDENGFMVGAGLPFTKSHRHWSHLLMVWPLHLLSCEQPENRELVEKSLKHWLTVDHAKQIYGWSAAAASHLYSTMGDGGNALKQLRSHHDDKRFVMPNTQYIEGSPVYECALIAASSLQYMLLQSWGGTIRIFPAMPAEWKESVFHDLRAEGAFLISAGRKDGKTRWVRIKSLAGEPCKVRPGFDGAFTSSAPAIPMKEIEPGLFELGLAKGQEVMLFQDAADARPEVAACVMSEKSANFWGLKDKKTK